MNKIRIDDAKHIEEVLLKMLFEDDRIEVIQYRDTPGNITIYHEYGGSLIAKTCKSCGFTKLADDYSRNNGGLYGLKTECKECTRERDRIYDATTYGTARGVLNQSYQRLRRMGNDVQPPTPLDRAKVIVTVAHAKNIGFCIYTGEPFATNEPIVYDHLFSMQRFNDHPESVYQLLGGSYTVVPTTRKVNAQKRDMSVMSFMRKHYPHRLTDVMKTIVMMYPQYTAREVFEFLVEDDISYRIKAGLIKND